MSNSYYNHGVFPTPNSPGSSAAMRAELEAITDGFDLLPTLTGNGYKVAMINAAGTALIASAALQALAITGSTINSTTIGASSPSTGAFTTLSASSGITGNLTGNVTGNLTGNVTGDITSTGSSSFTNAVITGGTINNVPIGASTAQTVRGTTITATVGFVGGLTGNVTGNVTGNLTGNVTGNVTGDVTGNVTGNITSTGTSTFNNVTISGTLDMSSATSATITGLSAPTGDSDAANKAYVDTVSQGLDAKASCRVATTANITLSGTQTIDGVAVISGDRVLVKDQSTASQNGIYVVAAGSWSRSTDANTWDELVHAFTFVEEGTAGANNGFVCTVTAGGTLGSTSVTWVQFSGAGQITAGTGMTKSGNTLNVNTASSARIVVGADEIDLATTGVTVGTYKSVTVDQWGRVTAGTNPTTLAGFGISDAYTIAQVDALFGSTTSAAASAAAAATSASNASTSASNASTSATNASNSATAAAASASAAAASFDQFDDLYLGAKATAPTVDNDGNPLQAGALYFNTSSNLMYVYTGAAWAMAGSSVNGTSSRQVYTATSGQTTFAITYDVGFVDVYLNGVKLQAGVDFIATSGSSVVLTTGATSGDIVDMIAYGSFNVANTYTQAEADARFLQITTAASTYLGISTAASTYLPLTSGTLTGNLIVNAGTDSRYFLQVSGTTQAQFQATATTIRLASNNALPLALATNGIDRVTIDDNGNITFGSTSASGAFSFKGTNTGDLVVLESTDASGSAAPDLVLYRNSASPAAADQVGVIIWRGKDSGGADQQYARIGAELVDPTAGSEDGDLWFETTVAGAATERMRLSAAGLGIGLTPVANNGILQLGSYGAIKALIETATITAGAPSATTAFDAITQAVQYYTSNNTTNFTLNLRGNGSTSLNTIMQVGQSLTVALMVTNGATAYYPNVIQVDGTTVTPKWQGGTAPSSGNASSIDVYTFTVVKTASATFTVLAAQSQFK